jgi:serine/threonine protein kinase
MKVCPKCHTEYPDTTTLCPADGVALEKTDDSLLGQTLAGKYRLDERISEGGMGSVYRGTHVLMDKTVAVKVLRPSLAADEKIVARFSREARAASRINHPHALSVTDFGEDENGVVFLVMEYLSGRTLKEIIRENGPMPLPRVVEILKQVTAALDVAHQQGVVHRDLKSDNIMLLSTNGADYAKVLDFGIAKIQETEGEYDGGLTAPDLIIGTPQYMSPEQCSEGGDIDARSDVYSLGVILYEMLVGHVPFTGKSPTTIMLQHMQEPPPSVLEERPDLPASISRVITRAMAKLPVNRYQSAGELVEDLAAVAGVDPRLAPPVVTGLGEYQKVTTRSAGTASGEVNEETLVRPRVIPRQVVPIPPRPTQPVPSVASFNPWKILIPSLVGLLVLFGVIYALTRNSQTTNGSSTQPALVADPNSQPVEPAQPATGRNEAGIPAGGNSNQSINANVSANANLPAVSPTPLEENFEPNANVQPAENTNANVNSNRTAPPLPSPRKQINSNSAPEGPPPSVVPTTNPSQPAASPPVPNEEMNL